MRFFGVGIGKENRSTFNGGGAGDVADIASIGGVNSGSVDVPPKTSVLKTVRISLRISMYPLAHPSSVTSHPTY
jgi:hypothetical protein